jgi:hypothetical protein
MRHWLNNTLKYRAISSLATRVAYCRVTGAVAKDSNYYKQVSVFVLQVQTNVSKELSVSMLRAVDEVSLFFWRMITTCKTTRHCNQQDHRHLQGCENLKTRSTFPPTPHAHPSVPHEVRHSPDQAAHYHTLCRKLGASSLTGSWLILK